MKTLLLLLAVIVFAGAARAQLVPTNVALGKPVTGDTAFGYPPTNGNDGNVATFNHANNTNPAPNNPFWAVDLQAPFDLTHIEIVDRIGCCDPNRLNGSEIHVLDALSQQIGATILVDGLPPSSPNLATGTRTFDNGGAGWPGAKFVRIDGHTQFFQFSEFRAIALQPAPAINVALTGLITSSGPVYTNQAATAIIDGSATTFAHPLDGANTLGYTFTVNLLEPYTFDRLELVNRHNCCPERLSNVRVTIHPNDGTGAPGPPVWTTIVRGDGTNSGMGGIDTLTAALNPAGTFAGQFIRVENLSNVGYNPQLAELRAFTFAPPPVSLAAGKPVTLYDGTGIPAAIWGGFLESFLVDGVPGTFSHPLAQFSANYYYQIDLGAPTAIGQVRVNGRLDGCCPERLQDSRLEILDDALSVVFTQILTGQVTTQVKINTGTVTGRYLRITNTSGADWGPQVGELVVLPPDPAAGFLFQITSSTINSVAGTGSVTFTSEVGATYGLYGSANMSAWTQIGGSISSGGTTTTSAFTDPALTGATRRYYEVKKLP